MIDDALKKLARKAPSPLEDAKRQAIAAALQAYDRSGREKPQAPQGSQAAGRLTHIATSIWSGLMKQRLMTGSALATLMILPAVAYVSWQVSQEANLPAGLSTSKPVDKELHDQTDMAAAPVEVGPLAEAEPSVEAAGRQGVLAIEAPAGGQLPLAKPMPKLQGGAESSAQNQAYRGLAHEGAATQAARSPSFQRQLRVPALDADGGRDRVQGFETHGVKAVVDEPVSTFSADVDTASYAMMRRALQQGYRPDPQTVRVEELINYFPYGYVGPDTAATPFRATVTVTPTPWNENTKLLHIGVKGYDLTPAERPRANLVFLIDVSGSMNANDKLPLLKSAFRLLVNTLDPDDTVSIVTYAGDAGTVLEPTRVADKDEILDAMDRLRPGGSTAGAQGLEEAYRLAEQGFVEDGVNRVMLATDGDFNVGPQSDDALKALVERKRESGVFLSVLGFGQGNYNDQLMQAIAQNGNGTAAYIDTLSEAHKILVQEASASLFPIASDVKLQVEFNPAVIAEYRQIGFETRALNREDFNNDRVDAGEIGSGHTVTAIYEITPVGSPAVLNSALRYRPEKPAAESDHDDELAFLKIRAKLPGETESSLTEIAVTTGNEMGSFDEAPDDVRFSVAVAAFGQKLRGTGQVASYGYDAIEQVASEARGADPYGYRAEFLQLVRLADSLDR